MREGKLPPFKPFSSKQNAEFAYYTLGDGEYSRFTLFRLSKITQSDFRHSLRSDNSPVRIVVWVTWITFYSYVEATGSVRRHRHNGGVRSCGRTVAPALPPRSRETAGGKPHEMFRNLPADRELFDSTRTSQPRVWVDREQRYSRGYI